VVTGPPTWRRAVRAARAPLRQPVALRSAWVLVDQSVSSLTNFMVAALVAREVSGSSFGAFSIAMLLYMIVVSVVRALVSQPLAIRVSARPDQMDEVAAAAGAAVLCGMVAGVAIACAAAAIGGLVGPPLVMMGVFLPALMLQDTWRFALFTMGQPARAAVNDLTWAATQTVLVVLVLTVVGGSLVLLTGAWAGGAVVAAALGVRQTNVVPAVGQSLSYLHRHIAIGWRFAGEAVLGNGTVQVTMLVMGTVVGAAGVGAIRAGSILFGPFTVAVLGLMTGGLAEGSRLLARSPRRFMPALSAISGLLLAVTLAWGVVLLTVPDAWGRAVLGDTWPGARDLLVPFTAATAGCAVASGPWLGLRVVAAASAILRLGAVSGCVTFVAGVAGAVLWDAPGGAWGLALGWWTTALGAWWLLGQLHRERSTAFSGHVRRIETASAMGSDPIRGG
jgi:O-antigen/teichoic acid export membrane protein